MNYYEVLGVSTSSSPGEIKAAYRKLALQYHPDKNLGNTESEAKFKEITQAYETLGDPQKKAAYDAGPTPTFEFAFVGAELNAAAQVSIPFQSIVADQNVAVTYRRKLICNTCSGTKGTTQNCSMCGGSGHLTHTTLNMFFKQFQLCLACRGAGAVVLTACSGCSGNGVTEQEVTIGVVIPAGVASGVTLRAGKQGHFHPKGAVGDLLLRIKVEEDSRWEREGNNVVSYIRLTYPQLMLGANVEVETLWGKETLTIPVKAECDSIITLRRKGPPHLNRLLNSTEIERGDHKCILKLKIPESNDEDRHQEVLTELEKLYS